MKLYLLVALAIVGVSAARVVREAPSEASEASFMDKIEAGLKELEKMAVDAAGAANTDELKQRAGEHIDVLTQQFNQFTDKVKHEAEQLKENEMVKDLRQTVDKQIEDIKETVDKHMAKFKEEQPETYNQISHHVDTVKNAGSAIASKIDALTNSEDAKKLKEASMKFIDDAKNGFLSLITDLKAEGEKKE